MPDKDEQAALAEQTIRGLRDSLLRPMHDSLVKCVQAEGEKTRATMRELLGDLAEAIARVKWDEGEA